MSDIVTFIRERLAEEEADALAGGGPNERWIADGGIHRGHPTDEVVDYVHGGAGPHIARQDPAATLARVAALRDLMAELAFWSIGHEEIVYRKLAAIWNNHPDFDADWTP